MRRVFIANRGEIALRAVRACRKLGLETVSAYSGADAASPHVFAADHAICIGPPAARASYLSVPTLVQAALGTGCDAVYPGYGFLAEKAGFARACAAASLTFIGPSAEAIEAMGDKVAGRRLAAAQGLPVVPGS